MGFIGLAVTLALTVGFSGDATAKHEKHLALTKQGQNIQTASVQEIARPVMRYYGGPKSPMWSSQ